MLAHCNQSRPGHTLKKPGTGDCGSGIIMSTDRKTSDSESQSIESDLKPPKVASGTLKGSKPQRAKVITKPIEQTTYFAPAERARQQDVETTIQLVSQSPVTTALLRSATAMMCILNEHRQIVTINTAYLDSLDVAHADDVIGLRPGEAMRCVHSNDHPGGCGTGPFCHTCDAAIAIIASQTTGRPVERECVISITNRKGESRDLALSVRASPFDLKGERFTVYCMTDIGVHKLFDGLERTFLHDLSNLATALSASSEMLRRVDTNHKAELIEDVYELSKRLSREIVVQRLMLSAEPSGYHLNWSSVNIGTLLVLLERVVAHHPSAKLKHLVVQSHPEIGEITTDPTLLERVLINMLVNAFEATEVGDEVRMTVDRTPSELRFTVHNAGCISAAVAGRVFQRHFSTKQGPGRGQGTFAMRLLGEMLLRGKVGFTTDSEQGTSFFLALPLKPDTSTARPSAYPRSRK